MIDSKSDENGLDKTGSGIPNCDKQQPIAARKTALRDLQNDNRIMAPNPLPSSPFLKDKGQTMDAMKVSGTKRPAPESPASPPCHQSPSSNGANAQFVYIRRKSEQELVKNNTVDNSEKNADGPQLKQISQGGGQETSRQQIQVQGANISCYPALAPMPMASVMTLSSGGPSVPNSLGKPVNSLPTAVPNHPPVSSEAMPVNPPAGNNVQNWKERFNHLQAFLRNCDHSNQEEYIQMLRSLSPVARSKHAVDLEKRAIHLTFEENKQMQRMNILNVLGKPLPKNNISPTSPQVVQLGK